MSTPAKSREEILAERKARKKNKGSSKNQPKTKDLDPALLKAAASISIQEEISSIIGDDKSLEKVETVQAKTGKNLSQASNKVNEGSRVVTPDNKQSETTDQQKSNKSREEILAEREAKKLAKQSAKKKDKVSAPQKSDIQKEKNEGVKAVEIQISDVNSKTPDIVPDSKTTETVDTCVKDESTENEKVEGKSKAQLRAERRAKQEAQRAKKLEQKLATTDENKTTDPVKAVQVVKVAKPTPQPVASHRVKLFAHLYHDLPDSSNRNLHVKIHPNILRLGTQFSSGIISGANVRCLALLNAFKTVITDYETPQNQEFSRGLEGEITKSMSYLNKCRPVAVSMVNAVKHLKYQVSHVKGTEMESKSQLKEWIDTYIKEQLETAAEAICLSVRKKITNNDVILTYGCSSLIQRLLISASNKGLKFRVIVVDGRPWLEGREMLRKLVSVGIHCTYIFVNGLSFIMPEVTKVLLGAHALLANGYVMSRAGSSQIALLAKAYNVPVLVCCETHKFSERVQTDSFVYNELGDPDDLVSNKGCLSTELASWKSIPYLTPLNLKYDVTPPDLVSAVVTEIAVLPCTSVPVILRIKPPEVSC